MTLKDCYFALEGDYEEVVGRLYSEALVQKFAVKFLADKSFQLLDESLKAGSYEEAEELCCEEGTPGLRKKRTSYFGNEAVEYTISITPEKGLVFKAVIRN